LNFVNLSWRRIRDKCAVGVESEIKLSKFRLSVWVSLESKSWWWWCH